MDVANNIKIFLTEKLHQFKINRKEFAGLVGISYHTICQIFHNRTNPSIVTIIKIANYFNCSIDEIIGRKNYISQNEYRTIDVVLDSWNIYLKDFIQKKLSNDNINPYKFSENIGFDHETIVKFINDTSPTRTLNTAIIIAISDYFNISMDQLIGRTK
ncbi:helix-turn-helix family protein [Rickettsia endosymbiont of Ixodes pacificus]|uniref:helix-turn-helix transcriptional regulator n=1 Tax=Rickettsia endosymbiont of Ixodes pacificus TaxID=1133329 RepID=UPI00061EAE10|nr:helix-turn-helix transcriptional regulator [Rickettsia endosymbiont of Ixodes pacificus]AKS10387.1 helix-turn-helix protein [Rickettsia endosymbiont of Ixodes pacificus]KJW01822.1 helix-turn-helix family protein [Rickettsia endosymbiont of Ixodes pacificus]